MRLALLSDVHANSAALRATLDDAAARGATRIVCLGDIVGYNTEPDACVALLRARDPLCVAGNHDRAGVDQVIGVRVQRRAVLGDRARDAVAPLVDAGAMRVAEGAHARARRVRDQRGEALCAAHLGVEAH